MLPPYCNAYTHNVMYVDLSETFIILLDSIANMSRVQCYLMRYQKVCV